jgi:preprotein translocase subunit YajC
MFYHRLIMFLLESDFLRSIGKIYVVALVSLIVWVGIIYFLIRLERKVKNLEDQMK